LGDLIAASDFGTQGAIYLYTYICFCLSKRRNVPLHLSSVYSIWWAWRLLYHELFSFIKTCNWHGYFIPSSAFIWPTYYY